MTATIPQVDPDDDALSAALAYADGGLYVGWLKAGTKHPGSIMGTGWHTLTTRDPQVIAANMAGTDAGVFIHAGRSGLIVADVDNPDKLHPDLARAIAETNPPRQSTRPEQTDRAHYLFAVPPGRTLGNSLGTLASGWGEMRGHNGVIVAAPTRHKEGGLYQWQRVGPVPVLPEYVAAHLPEHMGAAEVATDAQVSTFLDTYEATARPELLDVRCRAYANKVAAGESRHGEMTGHLAGAMREAKAGYYGARVAADTLESLFLAAVAQQPKGKQGQARSGAIALNEWRGLLAWAVAQAIPADDETTKARSEAKVPDAARLVVNLEQIPQDDTEAAHSDERPSWAAVDLSTYLDGTHTPAVPTLLARTDGVCLLYPGLVHSLHGESESGKSLVAQYLAAQQIKAGHAVLFIDFESDAGSVTERLLMFGATPAQILALFTYIRPEMDPRSAGAEMPAWHAMLARSYVLAVIDGVTDSLGIFGYSTKDNDDVAAWMRVLPKNIAKRTGAAVTVIDHVVKDNDSRGRFAIGAQAKMSGLTGAGYTVEVTEPLGRGLRGVIVLRVGKDRPGYVRGRSGPMRKSDRTQEAARVVIDSTLDPDRPAVTVEPWRGSDGAPIVARSFRPTGLMEKISEALEAAPEPLSARGIKERVAGKREAVNLALDLLVSEAWVDRQDGARNALLHTVVRTYRQKLDPLSDMYPPEQGHTQPPKSSVTVPHLYTGDGGTHTQPFPGTLGGTVGHGRICELCPREVETPGRGICTRCDRALPSTPASAKAAS